MRTKMKYIVAYKVAHAAGAGWRERRFKYKRTADAFRKKMMRRK